MSAVDIAVCVCMLLLLLCVQCRHQPRPCLLLSLIIYAIPQTHSMLGYCGTYSCVLLITVSYNLCNSADTQHAWLLWHIFLRPVNITLQRLLGQFVPAVAVCTMQAPCYDNSAVPTRAGL